MDDSYASDSDSDDNLYTTSDGGDENTDSGASEYEYTDTDNSKADKDILVSDNECGENNDGNEYCSEAEKQSDSDDIYSGQKNESTNEIFEGDYCIMYIVESDTEEINDEEIIEDDTLNEHIPNEHVIKHQDIQTNKPPLSKKDQEIKELIDSGDAPDDTTAKLVMRLMTELKCKRQHAVTAAKCKSWRKANACVGELINKDKRLRKIQANHDLSLDDSVVVGELIGKGISENEAAEAVKKAGANGAEDYIEEIHKQLQKKIRKLMTMYDMDRQQCLIAIDLMNFKCSEKLAAHLSKVHNEKDAKMEWQRLMKRFEENDYRAKFEEASNFNDGKKLTMILQLMEMEYEVNEIKKAVGCCDNVEEALLYFESKFDCVICFGSFAADEIFTLFCGHEMCKSCGKDHFTERIRAHRSIYAIVCPSDNCRVDFSSLNYDYFNILGNQLKQLLDDDTYNLFQNKLLYEVIETDSNFCWCPRENCGYGFIVDEGREVVECKECKHSFCPKCKGDWEAYHKGKSCDEIRNMIQSENPTMDSEIFIRTTLSKKGVECPKCSNKFELSRGGCMHFACTVCNYEFCQGCQQEYFNRNCRVYGDCNLATTLHAHHPRNCYFFLRDYSVEVLESLFQINNLAIPPSDFPTHTGKCQLIVQADPSEPEIPCDKDSTENHRGFCECHYKEFLSLKINENKWDPITVMDELQLISELKRHRKGVPEKLGEELVEVYKQRLAEAVAAEIPLVRS